MEDNVIDYLNAMYQAKLMLKKDIITKKEYLKIEGIMAKKYEINPISLYRQNWLINK